MKFGREQTVLTNQKKKKNQLKNQKVQSVNKQKKKYTWKSRNKSSKKPTAKHIPTRSLM